MDLSFVAGGKSEVQTLFSEVNHELTITINEPQEDGFVGASVILAPREIELLIAFLNIVKEKMYP